MIILYNNLAKELTELGNSFNGRIHEQLDQVKVLKDQLQARKQQLRQTEKKMNETKHKNKNIVEPLKQAKEEVDNLRIECKEFKKQKRIYNKRKSELKSVEERLKDVQWRHEVLFQRYELLLNEDNELKVEMKKALMRQRQMNNLDSIIEQKCRERVCSFLQEQYNDIVANKKGQKSSCNPMDSNRIDACQMKDKENNATQVDMSKCGLLQRIEHIIKCLNMEKNKEAHNKQSK